MCFLYNKTTLYFQEKQKKSDMQSTTKTTTKTNNQIRIFN